MYQLLRFEQTLLFRSWAFYLLLVSFSALISFFMFVTISEYPAGKTINSYLNIFELFMTHDGLISLFFIFITANLFLKEQESGFTHIAIALPIKNRQVIISKFASILCQSLILYSIAFAIYFVFIS